jgi:hypothetical protein
MFMLCLITFVVSTLLGGSISPLTAQDTAQQPSQKEPELVIIGKSATRKAKEDKKSTNETKPKEESSMRQPSMPQDFLFKLGDLLQVKATGARAKQITEEWQKTQMLSLYFDGVPIAELKSIPQQPEAGQLRLIFRLDRNANDDRSRNAWDALFKSKDTYEMNIDQPALGVGQDLPLLVHSEHPLQFYVATKYEIAIVFAVCLAILGLTYWLLVTKTDMLRDRGTGYYSLGKSQMAFWGLLVVLSFSGVWYLTGTMERIPPQVLVLIGISVATGLSAVVIGNSKQHGAQAKLIEKQIQLVKLQEENQQLQQTNNPESQIRLAAIQPEISALAKEINDISQDIVPGPSQGFWQDICDDGNGASFHRLQVVMWTVVLGAVFIQNVGQMMSMPEFPDTLLYLMGISNGTYIGFKFPE